MTAPGYLCPYCASHLDANNQITLLARNPSGMRGIISLSAELGDYTVHHNPALVINDGDMVELSCPVCHHELTDDLHETLSKIIRVDDSHVEQTILFSRIQGERSTFHITEEKTTSYGEHALRYQNPEWFLQVDE